MFWNTSLRVMPVDDERAGDEFGGVVHVLAREEDGLGLAGGAAGGVQAHRLVALNRQHAVGVDGAQVGAGGEGQPPDIGQRFDVSGFDAQFGESLLVEGHALGHALEGVLQELELQLFERRTGQGFRCLIPEHDGAECLYRQLQSCPPKFAAVI